MGFLYTYEHPGEDGGIWYAASYPMGATRYYRTPAAREDAVTAYVGAIAATGGSVVVVPTGKRGA